MQRSLLLLWWRTFQLEDWRTFQLVSTAYEPPTQMPQQHEPTEQRPEGDTIIGGMLDLSMLPDGTDPEEEAFRRQMQRKRKKKGKRI